MIIPDEGEVVGISGPNCIRIRTFGSYAKDSIINIYFKDLDLPSLRSTIKSEKRIAECVVEDLRKTLIPRGKGVRV